jgi:hypothetical protein
VEPVTLLQRSEFERRLAAAAAGPSPRTRHLAELRLRLAAERRARRAARLRALVGVRRAAPAPATCGC